MDPACRDRPRRFRRLLTQFPSRDPSRARRNQQPVLILVLRGTALASCKGSLHPAAPHIRPCRRHPRESLPRTRFRRFSTKAQIRSSCLQREHQSNPLHLPSPHITLHRSSGRNPFLRRPKRIMRGFDQPHMPPMSLMQGSRSCGAHSERRCCSKRPPERSFKPSPPSRTSRRFYPEVWEPGRTGQCITHISASCNNTTEDLESLQARRGVSALPRQRRRDAASLRPPPLPSTTGPSPLLPPLPRPVYPQNQLAAPTAFHLPPSFPTPHAISKKPKTIPPSCNAPPPRARCRGSATGAACEPKQPLDPDAT